MKSLLAIVLVVVAASLAGGCATGPKYQEFRATVPPIPDGQARVWVYRPSKMMGAAVQPLVHFNDVVVGKAQPGCYFHVDRPPGEYEVKTATEWADKLRITLAAGDEKYVRLTLLPGVFVGHLKPGEVKKEQALKELEGCRLITADGANKP